MPILKSVKEIIEKNQPSITHIDFSNCGLNDNDMVDLQELLQQNRYIDSVDLSDNNITDEGCILLSSLKIKKINLKNNHVRDKGIEYLLKNSYLKEIDISKNGLTDVGAKLLLGNIKNYTSLSISGNPDISDSLLQSIYSHFNIKFSNTVPIGIDLGKNVTSFFNEGFLNLNVEKAVSEELADKLIKTCRDETQSKNLSSTDIQNAIKSLCNSLGMEVEIKDSYSSHPNQNSSQK